MICLPLPIGKNFALPNIELNSSASRGRRLRKGYEVKSILGQGAFGLVKLVERKEDGRLFAMKVVEKWSILESRRIDPFAEQYVRNELKIGVLIRELHSPFLAKLCSAFQTEEKLYYLLDYYPGGELFSVLESRYPTGLPGGSVVLYVAEVICALSALHCASILHRDVRLENVLLDAEGHVRLCDYGLSLLLADEPGTPFMKRRTTELYVGANAIFQAPETYTENGYGGGLDFWQLGIMTYVMCTGHFPPPRETPRRSAKILDRLQDRVETHPELPSFVVCLLDECDVTRLGYATGTDELVQHDLFMDTDWGAVTSTAKSQHLIDVSANSEPKMVDDWKKARDSNPTNYQQDLLSFRNFTFLGSRDHVRTSKLLQPDEEREQHIAACALTRYSSKTFDSTCTSDFSSSGDFHHSLRYSGASYSTEDKRTPERSSPFRASKGFGQPSGMSTIAENKINALKNPVDEEYNVMNPDGMLDSGDEFSPMMEDDDGCVSDTGSLVLTIPSLPLSVSP